MKAVGFFPEAQAEFDHGLANSPDPAKFRRLVVDVLQNIASGRITHAAIPRTSCRRCILTEIPYSIIYQETADRIRVVAIPHHKRRTGYWKQRLRLN